MIPLTAMPCLMFDVDDNDKIIMIDDKIYKITCW